MRALALEPFIVPTGSMAPVLLGHHKSVECPRCGFRVDVGCRETDDGFASLRSGTCPHCGSELDLSEMQVCPGDQLLVNKTAFDWRRPRRWELAVFRCPLEPGRAFVKRVVGLPGESVQIKDGDVYIDHDLARKSLPEADAVRVLVFDQSHRPTAGTVPPRWLAAAGPCEPGTPLHLDAGEQPQRYSWLIYDHGHAPGNKAGGVRDEYPYNGTSSGECAVHDFILEGDLEVVRGDGWAALGITDGGDDLVVELPLAPQRGGATVCGTTAAWYRGLAGIWPAAPGEAAGRGAVYRAAPEFWLRPGRTYHVQLAFVDRRLTLAVDGALPLPPVDRPPPDWRDKVERPVRLGASGAELRWHNVRLYRDVHYTPAGSHASSSPVRLGAGEYFVLGDNSPSSQDSRFWTGADGRPVPVAERLLGGKPFLVHYPSRVAPRDGPGGGWESPGPDWGRVRWLR